MTSRRKFTLVKKSVLCFAVVGEKVLYREPKETTMREMNRIRAFKSPMKRKLENDLKEFRINKRNHA